jgi:hypothetical protein
MDCLRLKSKLFWNVLFLSSLGCTFTGAKKSGGAAAVDVEQCSQVDPTHLSVITEAWFGRIENGVSRGADLDGDAPDCGHSDYVDEDGNTGIDNALGGLLPLLDLTEFTAVEVYIQDTINWGELLLMIEMEDVDDVENDPCVNVNLLRGLGEPTVGTDKIIESGQTFDRDLELPMSRSEGMTIEESRLVAGPLDLPLPVQYFDDHLTIHFQEGTLRHDIGEDGYGTGFLAGGVRSQDIVDFVDGRGDIDVGDLLISMLDANSDLWPDEDGICRGFSAVLEFKTKPAFFYLD